MVHCKFKYLRGEILYWLADKSKLSEKKRMSLIHSHETDASLNYLSPLNSLIKVYFRTVHVNESFRQNVTSVYAMGSGRNSFATKKKLSCFC